jgi:CSN8/PSMD8/EIF3K family
MNSPFIRFRWREGWHNALKPYKAASSHGGEPQAPKLRDPAFINHQQTTPTAHPSNPPECPQAPSTLVPAPGSYLTTQTAMAAPTSIESDLQSTIRQLHACLQHHEYTKASSLLSRARVALLQLNVLTPLPNTSIPASHLQLAREVLEIGALIAIRLHQPEAFTRYFQQLQSLYALPPNRLPRQGENRSKITGLYLLLLLSQGDYAGFHTLLETLEMAAAQQGAKPLEEDDFIQYPVRLEQALMEGSYDKVWGETKGERVPSEEFGVFSEVQFARLIISFDGSSTRIALTFTTGLNRHNPQRNRVMQRKGLLVDPHLERQESLIPQF